jgi:hypothetical protein
VRNMLLAFVSDDISVYWAMKRAGVRDLVVLAANLFVANICIKQKIPFAFQDISASAGLWKGTATHVSSLTELSKRWGSFLSRFDFPETDFWIFKALDDTLCYHQRENIISHVEQLRGAISPADVVFVADSQLPMFASNSSSEARETYLSYLREMGINSRLVKINRIFNGWQVANPNFKLKPFSASNHFAQPTMVSCIGPTFKFEKTKLESMFSDFNHLSLDNIYYSNYFDIGSPLLHQSEDLHDSSIYTSTVKDFFIKNILEPFSVITGINFLETSRLNFLNYILLQISCYVDLRFLFRMRAFGGAIVSELDGGLTFPLASFATERRQNCFILPHHNVHINELLYVEATRRKNLAFLGELPARFRRRINPMYDFAGKVSVNKVGVISAGKPFLDTIEIEQPASDSRPLCMSEISLIRALLTNSQRVNQHVLVVLNCPDRSYIQDVSWRRMIRHFNLFLGRLAEIGFEICFRDKPGWDSIHQFIDPTKLGAEPLRFKFNDQRNVDVEYWDLVYFPFGPSTYAEEFKNYQSVKLLSSGFRSTEFLDDPDFGTCSSVADRMLMTTIDELDRIVLSNAWTRNVSTCFEPVL